MSRAGLCALLAAALYISSAAVPAHAQDEGGAVSEDEKRALRKQEAKEHFSLGAKLHKDGDFAGAAEAYKKSYDALPLPIMLFNVAQVMRLGGNVEGAIEHYERYLGLEPEGRGAEDSTHFLTELRRAQEEATGAAEEGPGDESTEEDSPQPPVEDAPPVAPDPERDQPIDIEDDLDSGSSLKTAGLITAAAGLVSLGAAGVFAWRSSAAESDLSDFSGEWNASQAERYQSGRRMHRASIAFGVIGLAAVAVGGGLYYWGRDETDARLDVATTGDGLAALWSGSF